MEGGFVRRPVNSRFDGIAEGFSECWVAYLDRATVKFDVRLAGFAVALHAVNNHSRIAKQV